MNRERSVRHVTSLISSTDDFWRCDYPNCKELYTASCGGTDDETEHSCNGRFCTKHLHVTLDPPADICGEVCASCKDKIEANDKSL